LFIITSVKMNPAANFPRQLQQLVQQPYLSRSAHPNGQIQENHPMNQGHHCQQQMPMHLPRHQFPQHQFPQYHFPQINPFPQIPLEEVHPSQVPPPQAPEWPQPFNEAELKVAGIMPYSYGMPRYGQVSFLGRRRGVLGMVGRGVKQDWMLTFFV
jgi:hypothetical protein